SGEEVSESFVHYASLVVGARVSGASSDGVQCHHNIREHLATVFISKRTKCEVSVLVGDETSSLGRPVIPIHDDIGVPDGCRYEGTANDMNELHEQIPKTEARCPGEVFEARGRIRV